MAETIESVIEQSDRIWNPDRPLCRCEDIVCSKTVKCLHCKKKIALDAPAVRLAFVQGSHVNHMVHAECMEPSGYAESRLRMNTRSYAIEQFVKVKPFEPELSPLFADFDFDKAMQILINPPDWRPRSSIALIPRLIGVLTWCGYSQRIVAEMKNLPAHVWILLSMHDDDIFQKEAARLFDASDLPQSFDLLRKKRNSLDELLSVARCGKAHPELRAALKQALLIYDLDQTDTFCAGKEYFFGGFEFVRNAQVCYFFIEAPQECLRLQQFLETGAFAANTPGHFLYSQAAYYRAAVLHLILTGDVAAAKEWLAAMPHRIHHIPSGNPKGFINDTDKMATELIKMQMSK